VQVAHSASEHFAVRDLARGTRVLALELLN
jgi:hypothetical protein